MRISLPNGRAARAVAGASALAVVLAAAAALGLTQNASAEDFPDSDPDKIIHAPAVAPCTARYQLVADITPALGEKDAKRSIKEGFATNRQWGTRKNVAVVPAAQAHGLNEPALRVTYPKGTSSPGDKGKGGAGFYAGMNLPPRTDRACLAYKVRFPAGFDWVKGGKLPGLYGGKAPSGGKKVTGRNGFSMRFMWREEGKGELYEYIVNKDEKYGLSVGRGLWTFPTGRWVEVQQEIILNDPDEPDGIARVWIDGRPIFEQNDIVYRTTDDLHLTGLMFSTFFGGNGEEWRTPRDQTADFGDFRLYAPASQAATLDAAGEAG